MKKNSSAQNRNTLDALDIIELKSCPPFNVKAKPCIERALIRGGFTKSFNTLKNNQQVNI